MRGRDEKDDNRKSLLPVGRRALLPLSSTENPWASRQDPTTAGRRGPPPLTGGSLKKEEHEPPPGRGAKPLSRPQISVGALFFPFKSLLPW